MTLLGGPLCQIVWRGDIGPDVTCAQAAITAFAGIYWARGSATGWTVAMDPVFLLDMTAEPAFASDEVGRIVLWNAEAGRLLGYEAEEVVGRPCWDVIQGTDLFGNQYCVEHCNPLTMLEHHGPIHGFEIDVRKASGELVRAAFSLVVARGASPGKYTVVHLMRPVPDPRPDERTTGGEGASGEAHGAVASVSRQRHSDISGL